MIYFVVVFVIVVRCSCRRRRRRLRRRCCLAWLYFVFTQHSLSWHMIFAIQCLYSMAISLFVTRTNRLCITLLVHIYIYSYIQHKQSTRVLAMTIKTFTQMSNFVYALYGFSSFIFFFIIHFQTNLSRLIFNWNVGINFCFNFSQNQLVILFCI